MTSKHVKGTVYFLQRGDGLIKIGFTASFDERFATLSKSHPGLRTLKIISGDLRREREIHQALKRHNEYGEWFRPEPAVIDFIAVAENGTYVTRRPTKALKDWARYEESHSAACQQKAKSLFEACSGWRFGRATEVYAYLEATYGLAPRQFQRLYQGETSSPSSALMSRVTEAYIAEMTLLKEHLIAELAALGESGPYPDEFLIADEIARLEGKFTEITQGLTQH